MTRPASYPPAHRASGGRIDAGFALRLALVAAAHVLLIALIAHLNPEVRRQIVPVLVELITPPVPLESPPVPAPREARPKPVAKAAQPTPQVAPTQVPLQADSVPAPAVITVDPPPRAPESPPSPAAPAIVATPAPPAPPAPVVPPRFDAAYLNNPSPAYPLAAKRLGEQGKVVLRVLVTTDGRAEKVEIHASSGSPRLDQTAKDAVERWRFVPARQGDKPVPATVLVPVAFVLEG